MTATAAVPTTVMNRRWRRKILRGAFLISSRPANKTAQTSHSLSRPEHRTGRDFFLFLHKKARGVFHLRAVIFSVVSFFVAVRSFFHLRTLLFPVPVLRRDFIRVSGADVIRETFYVFTSLANSFAGIKPVTVIQYMCFFSMLPSVSPLTIPRRKA